ncbi:MAG: hypothetical protein L6R40_005514 [Gallowayella cf. fulva]|nr:MAG: hypothetical protein L6R40_005514 [Xanthomendoza cf. fulva]
MVAQGLDVPPALTRGGNNQLATSKTAKISKVERSTKAGSARRNTKRGGRKPKRGEQSDEDTEEEDFEIHEDSGSEAPTKKTNGAKGKAKDKRPSRNNKAAKRKQRAEGISDEIKDEPECSVEREGSQTRYGVGDDMWALDGIEDAKPGTKGVWSSESSSQYLQPPTKVIILNVGRAGLAKVGGCSQAGGPLPEDNGGREGTVASDAYSDNDDKRTLSGDDSLTPKREAEVSNQDGLQDNFGVYHGEDGGHNLGLLGHGNLEEDLVASSALYDQDQTNAMSGLNGHSPALAFGARQSNHGSQDNMYRSTLGPAGFVGVADPGVDDHDISDQAYRIVDHRPSNLFMAKSFNQAADHTSSSHKSHLAPPGFAHNAYHGYTTEHLLSQPTHTHSYGTTPAHLGNGAFGTQLSDREMPSADRSHFAGHSHNRGGLHSSYSSTDSYHPHGGDFGDIDMDDHVETPVALTRNNSAFDHMPFSQHRLDSPGMNWGAFFDASGHGSEY